MAEKILQGLILFSLIFLNIKVYSQQKLGLESWVPPAPNAAELAKYGTYPVGTVTGIPEINFPLYEINSGKLKLTIQLAYHSTGNQVNQRASDVGLGWSLMAGGTISRTVYGAADDSPRGYFNYRPPTYQTLTGISNFYTMQEYNIVNGLGYDLEPDLFVYNIGGKSGKFIHDKSNNGFLTIPFNPITVQKTTSAIGQVFFRIVDDDGTVYKFERTSTTQTDDVSTIGSWYLTSVTSADLKDNITIEYESVNSSEWINQQYSSIGKDNKGFVSVPINNVQSNIKYGELRVKRIVFNNGFVQFDRKKPRQDFYGVSSSDKSLDEILVYDSNNQLIKRIGFNYEYFYSGNHPVPEGAKKRLKLTGFKEYKTASTDVDKEYSFDYNNTALPPYGSYNIDFWGFYNGANNQSLIPTRTVYARDLNLVGFTNGSQYNNSFINGTQSWIIGSSNRNPSASHMKAAILKRVTYPTGGYTEFEFEPHKYLSKKTVERRVSYGGRTDGINPTTKDENSYFLSQL